MAAAPQPAVQQPVVQQSTAKHSVAQQPAAQQPAKQAVGTSTEELVAELNKHLNLSGRADQYRLDPGSSGNVIQQINPANGEVLGEFLVSQFPALARSLGISGGTFVNERA